MRNESYLDVWVNLERIASGRRESVLEMEYLDLDIAFPPLNHTRLQTGWSSSMFSMPNITRLDEVALRYRNRHTNIHTTTTTTTTGGAHTTLLPHAFLRSWRVGFDLPQLDAGIQVLAGVARRTGPCKVRLSPQ